MRKVLFGSPVLTQYYREMREKIFEYKLYQAYQLEANSRFITMTLFNTYRYQKNLKNSKISAYYFNFKLDKWCRARVYEGHLHLARISQFPSVTPLKNHNMLPSMIDMMLSKLQQFVDQDKYYFTYDRTAWRMNRVGISIVNQSLHKLILKYAKLKNNLVGHSKYITKFIWQHFIDKSVLSSLVKINGFTTYFQFSDYIYVHNNRKKLIRVTREHPNLLPLLKYIPVKYWDEPNLFSFDYWTNKHGVVEINRIAKVPFPCMTKKQWRWLKKQSPKLISQWYGQNISGLVECGIQGNIPVCVKVCIIKLSNDFTIFGEQQTQVIRLFISHMISIWQEQGFRALQCYLKTVGNQLSDIIDYWQVVGRLRGIPQSWERIVERSNEWHQQYLFEQQQAQDEEHKMRLALQWDSPIIVWEDRNTIITALNRGQELFDEGQIMRHCIFSYVNRCAEGEYLVFSIIEQDENQTELARSTLGIYRDTQHHIWKIDQHRGRRNGPISQNLIFAGKKLCQQLNLL